MRFGIGGNRTGLSRHLTLREECAMQQELFTWSQDALTSTLCALALETVLNTRIGALSYGQQRKAGLLMMLMARKTLWILDEPLLALDTKSLNFFWQALYEHQQAGGMAILSSHQTLPKEAGLSLLEYAL